MLRAKVRIRMSWVEKNRLAIQWNHKLILTALISQIILKSNSFSLLLQLLVGVIFYESLYYKTFYCQYWWLKIHSIIFGKSLYYHRMPLSAAKTVTWYREKNKEKIRKIDNLRKKHQILVVKVNDPIKNMEKLRKQNNRKVQHLLAYECSITCATIYSSSISSAPSASSPTSSTTLISWYKSFTSRILRKANSALPRTLQISRDRQKSW